MNAEKSPKWIYLGNVEHEWFEIMHCVWPRFIMRITESEELNGNTCSQYEIVNWLDKVGYLVLGREGLREEMRDVISKRKTALLPKTSENDSQANLK